jgi:SAM-dependent methyltransferase
MEILTNDIIKEWQEKIYADRAQWDSLIVLKFSARLSCILRYAKILQFFGLLKTDELMGNLKILEPGCGIGAFSILLANFGEVYGIDYSKIALETASRLFEDNKFIKFIDGNGAKPSNVPDLAGKKFDFIIMKEFYPVCKIVVDNPRPIDVVKEYYDLLSEKGILIIEHALEVFDWKKNDEPLQTSKIIKEFNALVFNSFILDIILFFPSVLKRKYLRLILSKLLNPIIILLCLLKKFRLSKTIIIRK